MRISLVIVTFTIVILGMIIEANAKLRVHSEYTRRQWLRNQNHAFTRFNELPAGVHYEYKRRRQTAHGRSAARLQQKTAIPRLRLKN